MHAERTSTHTKMDINGLDKLDYRTRVIAVSANMSIVASDTDVSIILI